MIQRFGLRSEVRLACFGLSALLAVYIGFIGLDVDGSGMVVKRFGYYFMLVTFALWLMALWRLWSRRAPGVPVGRGEKVALGAVVGLLTLIALAAETFRCKVLYDEFVLQSTAYNMHFFREAATMVRGYDILGVFLSTDSYLDKRPNFFPFLISLVHDLTGYRPANAFGLNSGLFPVVLLLTYYLGRRLNGPRGGLLAVLLFGSLPLLGQNATGSGMELLNIAMILTVAALGAAYLRQPDEGRLSPLVLGTVLLAQTRYESAVYVVPVVLIIGLGWWRQRRIALSWASVAAPLLLLPCALQNKVLSNSRWMWELKENQDTRFSFDYVPGNLRAAQVFFANTGAQLANSWPLTLLGLAALGYVAWRLLRPRRLFAAENSDRLALFFVGLGAITNTVLIMFYYWSSLTDPLASRLSLPFYAFLVFAVVILMARLDWRLPASRILTGAMFVFTLGVTTSHAAQHLYSHLGIDEIEWEKRFVAARPHGERLVVSNTSTIPWLLDKIPSILIGRTRIVADRLNYQLEQKNFAEILVFQSMRPTSIDGEHEMVPEDRLPPGYELQRLTEKRFGTKIVVVSRLVAVKLPSPPANHASQSTP